MRWKAFEQQPVVPSRTKTPRLKWNKNNIFMTTLGMFCGTLIFCWFYLPIFLVLFVPHLSISLHIFVKIKRVLFHIVSSCVLYHFNPFYLNLLFVLHFNNPTILHKDTVPSLKKTIETHNKDLFKPAVSRGTDNTIYWSNVLKTRTGCKKWNVLLILSNLLRFKNPGYQV